MQQPECETRLLADLPSKADGFVDVRQQQGAHSRVARAIAQVISDRSTQATTIGLEGPWGSGKTTIIEMLRDEIAMEPDLAMFIFDAWAHEGDPLRRTFLETLVDFLNERKWIVNPEKWAKTIDVLAKRTRQTTTTTNHRATPFAKWFAFAALLVPLGIQLFSAALRDGLTLNVHNSISLKGTVGTLLVLAPIFVVIIAYVWHLYLRTRGVKTDPFGSLLTGDKFIEQSQNAIESSDPTSVEFERMFCDLIAEAFPNETRRRLVLVFDNLDRTSHQDSLSLWATLQAFVPSNTRNAHRDCVWVLVPYDVRGLSGLWDDEEQRESVLDKTFAVRFTVPQPVLSNWKAFLMDCVKQAFPTHTATEAHAVYRVFNNYNLGRDRAPTPRELKLFINQIGAAHRQWGDTFPLANMALFACLKDTARQNGAISMQAMLLSGDCKIRETLGQYDVHAVRGSLAAMEYNVDPTLAQQLLLAQPLFRAMFSGETDEFDRLLNLDPLSSAAVLVSLIGDKLADADASAIANAALMLREPNIKARIEQLEYASTCEEVIGAASLMETWPLSERVGRGISAIIDLAPHSAGLKRAIFAGVQNGLGSQGGGSSRSIVRALGLISQKMVEYVQALHSRWVIPVNAEEWRGFAENVAVDANKQVITYCIEPSCSADAIDQFLAHRIMAGHAADGEAAALVPISLTTVDITFPQSLAAIEKKFSVADDAFEGDEIGNVLQILSVLRQHEIPSAEGVWESLVVGGAIAHCIGRLVAVGVPMHLLAWSYISYGHFSPVMGDPPQFGTSMDGIKKLREYLEDGDEEIAAEWLEAIRIEKSAVHLWNIVDSHDYPRLAVQVLRRCTKESQLAADVFEVKSLAQRWSRLKPMLVEDEASQSRPFDLLVQIASAASDEKLIEITCTPKVAEFVLDILTHANVTESVMAAWAQGLQELDAKQWQSVITKNHPLVAVAIALNKRGALSFGHQCQDGIVAAAANMRTWKRLRLVPIQDLAIGLDTESSFDVLRQRLVNLATEADGNCSESFYANCGQVMNDDAVFTGSATVVTQLFSGIVRNDNLPGLRWLAELARRHPDLLSRHEESIVKDLGKRIVDKLGAGDSETERASLLKEIVQAWKLTAE